MGAIGQATGQITSRFAPAMSFHPAFEATHASRVLLPDLDYHHNDLTGGTFERITAETGFQAFAQGEGVEGFSERIKVHGHKRPYDDDWFYWAKRRGQQPGFSERVATLFERQ